MSTFIEAVMALREAALCVLKNVRERGISREWAIDYGTIEEIREAVHSPELSDEALIALDEAHARELARVKLEATMEERRAVLRALPKIVKKFMPEDDVMLSMRMIEYCYGYFGGGEHRKSDPVPITEPGPACSERGKEQCR